MDEAEMQQMEDKMIVNAKNQKIVLNKIAGLANWLEMVDKYHTETFEIVR